MVLSTTKRTSSTASITNISQGGGSKKAGFAYQVGRSSASSVVLGADPVSGRCCKLSALSMNLFPNAYPSRPIGAVGNHYYRVPGTQ